MALLDMSVGADVVTPYGRMAFPWPMGSILVDHEHLELGARPAVFRRLLTRALKDSLPSGAVFTSKFVRVDWDAVTEVRFNDTEVQIFVAHKPLFGFDSLLNPNKFDPVLRKANRDGIDTQWVRRLRWL